MVQHKNNIGLLRLILACGVIIGHAPEILDGDRHREPLTVFFHTLSLGECSVDAFFILSGYLITSSIFRTKLIIPYLINRISRIYPAFIVAYIICVAGLAPLVGAKPWQHVPETFLNLVFLRAPPVYPGELQTLHYHVLNGAMWSISYEFRCYLIICALWLAGILSRRRVMLVLTAAMLFGSVLSSMGMIPQTFDRWVPKGDWILGSPGVSVRLLAVFLVGTSAFLYKSELVRSLNWKVAVGSSIALLLMMTDKHFAEVAFAILGGYCIFWFSLKANIGIFRQINDGWDISYGMYLYGWPSAVLVAYMWTQVSPAELAVISLALAALAGVISWVAVEKWTKDPLRAASKTIVGLSAV